MKVILFKKLVISIMVSRLHRVIARFLNILDILQRLHFVSANTFIYFYQCAARM